MYFVFAFLLGMVSGLRALTSLAAVSCAARLGWLKVSDTALAFMGFKYTPIVFIVLAIGELINDKLPKTPSRKTPPQFIARILSGSLAGGTVGAAYGSLITGVVAGAIGAVVGTYGGAALRGRLAAAFGKDSPAALVEDVLAIVLSVVVVSRFQ
jgi:uncharacterized membrane protein